MHTIKSRAEYEFHEKKSRFIGVVVPVDSDEKTRDFLETVRSEYKSATHYCYAWRILDKDGRIVERKSDDGEPSGTAGSPMLSILTGQDNWINILAVVIRYFGGIKLGTGGLVSCYKKSVKEALRSAVKMEYLVSEIMTFITPVAQASGMIHFCQKEGIEIIEKKFTEEMTLQVRITREQASRLYEMLQRCNGRVLEEAEK